MKRENTKRKKVWEKVGEMGEKTRLNRETLDTSEIQVGVEKKNNCEKKNKHRQMRKWAHGYEREWRVRKKKESKFICHLQQREVWLKYKEKREKWRN